MIARASEAGADSGEGPRSCSWTNWSDLPGRMMARTLAGDASCGEGRRSCPSSPNSWTGSFAFRLMPSIAGTLPRFNGEGRMSGPSSASSSSISMGAAAEKPRAANRRCLWRSLSLG